MRIDSLLDENEDTIKNHTSYKSAQNEGRALTAGQTIEMAVEIATKLAKG